MSMQIIKRLMAAVPLLSIFCYGEEQAISQSTLLETFQSQPNKWDVFADVLVWSAQETCSEWAFIVPSAYVSAPSSTIPGSYDAVLKAVTFDWKAGVRTGIAYNIERDRWDTRFDYTWYDTHGTNHLSAPPGQVLQSQFIATDFLLTLPTFSATFDRAKIKWDISFNMFNWDLGRIFYLGKSLSLRPHIGLQGGWIDQDVVAHWYHSNTLIPYNVRETLKHHFWGIGPEVGVNTKWNFWKNPQNAFSFFGDFGQVFMWGHWSFNEVAHTTDSVTTINTQPDRNMGSLTFQSSAGFIWDIRFNKNRSLFTFKLGYEFQIWAQQLQFFQHFSGILNNALILQGATGRFLIEF
jgi:hypothetical protein